jgi:hypothetical protein
VPFLLWSVVRVGEKHISQEISVGEQGFFCAFFSINLTIL